MANFEVNCRFCSRTDNSIQVICEARCLICSRCQSMPCIRKLLIDHSKIYTCSNNVTTIPTVSDNIQCHQIAVKMGSCPICELPLSQSMLGIIKRFKEVQEKSTTEEGRFNEMELEENNVLITNFLKRFRNTYGEDGKSGVTSKGNLPSVTNSFDGERSKASKKIDIYAQGPIKETSSSMLEFIIDCYAAQWSSIIRNANESLNIILLRVCTKKKLSIRTNDFKTKAILDYLMSPVTSNENSEIYLFSYLIGLQPQYRKTISPAWSIIAVSLLVAANCDRCLKINAIYDGNGNPGSAEFKSKLLKSLSYPKSIAMKKAIRIIMLLLESSHPYWNITPLSAHCVGVNSRLPWVAASISKLYNVLFHYIFSYRPTNSNSNGMLGRSTSSAAEEFTSGFRKFSSVTEPFLTSHSETGIFNGESSEGLPSISMKKSQSNKLINVPSTSKVRSSQTKSRQNSIVINQPLFGRSNSTVSTNNLNNIASPTTLITNANTGNNNNTQKNPTVQKLKTIYSIASDVWNGRLNTEVSQSNQMQVWLDFLSNLNEQKSPGHYMDINHTRAADIAENITIPVSEFVYICTACWEMEFEDVKKNIVRGSTTSQRRSAIVGHYDSSQSSINVAERLALMKIIKMYSKSKDHPETSLDWDEIISKIENRLFPFFVPLSVANKSHNELNHLVTTLCNELQERRSVELKEDMTVESGPYAMNHPGIISKGGWNSVIKHQFKPETHHQPVNLEDVEMFNRKQYLESQKIGSGFINYDENKWDRVEVSTMALGSQHIPSEMVMDRDLIDIEFIKNHLQDSTFVPKDVEKESAFNKVLNTIPSPTVTNYHLPSGHFSRPFSANYGQNVPKESEMNLMEKESNPLEWGHDELKNAVPSRGKEDEKKKIFHTINHMIDRNIRKVSHGKISNEPIHHELHQSSLDDSQLSIESASTKLDYYMTEEDKFRIQLERLHEEEVDRKYKEKLAMMEYAKAMAARSRIKARIAKAKSSSSLTIDGDAHLMNISKNDPSAFNTLSNVSLETPIQVNYDGFYLDRMSQPNDVHYLEMTSTNMDSSVNSSLDVNTIFSDPIMDKYHKHHRLQQYLDINTLLDRDGKLPHNIATDPLAEKPSLIISTKNAPMTLQTFQLFSETFLKDWQLSVLVKLDVSGMRLGLAGALLLSAKLNNKCRLIHINLNGSHFGDMGLRKILQGIIAGGGMFHLLRMDLRENDITIATDAVTLFTEFSCLRSLDLSDNSFALDTKIQKKYFQHMLTNMTSLESLSLAGNKIQDEGFQLVSDIIIKKLNSLKLLDISKCFLTKKSIEWIQSLCHIHRDNGMIVLSQDEVDKEKGMIMVQSQLEEIQLQNNLFSPADRIELFQIEKYFSFIQKKHCHLSIDPPHLGIEYPLRYDLKQYGVDKYMI